MRKIKITIKEFDSILNMLNSNDKENKVVGLNTLNSLDFKSNLTMLFLLKKKLMFQMNYGQIMQLKHIKK
jgi:hypothetical protein